MIGIKYLRYYPERIFQLPSGLIIYKSCFLNPDGSKGVVGGPHRIFSEIESSKGDAKVFLTNQYRMYRAGYQVNPDIKHLQPDKPTTTCDEDISNEVEQSYTCLASRAQSTFEIAENAGSEIRYRCPKCRSCEDCKKHQKVDMISIREEIEQELIDKSVRVDVMKGLTEATLPLMYDPVKRLSSNKGKAIKVYQQQIKTN